MNKAPFLKNVCEAIRTQHGDDTAKLAVVLPSRRAGLYLRKYLAEVYKKAIISPEILSVDDFVRKHSAFEIEEPVSLIISLYPHYKRITGKNAEPFDSFVLWAPALISDYSDIHLYCEDPDKLFRSLNEEKALEVWSPDKGALSDIQKKYLSFWSMLPELMMAFDNALIKDSKAYHGLAFRQLAKRFQNLKEDFQLQSALSRWKNVIWAGFSALSDAEWTILRIMLENKLADAFFDTDHWYMDDEDHEAGHFLRRLKKKWRYGDFKWLCNDICNREDGSVTVIPMDGDVAQAKICGHLLGDEKAIPDPAKAAVLLPDEKLLIPVLNALPERIADTNVTMQWPLANTSIHLYLKALFAFWRDLDLKQCKEGIPVYHLYKLLEQNVMSKLLRYLDPEQRLQKYLKTNRFGVVPIELIDSMPNPLPALLNLYPGHKSGLEAISDALSELLNLPEADALSQVVQRTAELIRTHIVNICEELGAADWTIDSHTLELLCDIRIRRSGLSFFGEPLKGLQIMGMLEARALDFEQLIILSCNDDILPGKHKSSGFIPYRIRKAFGLPTSAEKEAVYAYHFYRLLQRNKQVYLCYNSSTSGLQNGEESRFIKQLTIARPGLINTSNFNFMVKEQPGYEEDIVKTPEVIKRIKQALAKSLSPTAINTLAACPLDYYYKYVLRLKEPESDTGVEDSDLGTIIHETLDGLYKNATGKVLNTELLKGLLRDVERRLLKTFTSKGYSEQRIKSGKLLLVRLIATTYINRFIESEIRYCKYHPDAPVTLIGCENHYEHILPICGIPVRLNGKVDRINQIASVVQILDYKTGGFKPSDIHLKSMDELGDEKKAKAMQLLTYAYLFKRNGNNLPVALQCGIVPLRLQPEAEMLKINKQKNLPDDFTTVYEQKLEAMISELLDKNINLQHNENASFCVFCK